MKEIPKNLDQKLVGAFSSFVEDIERELGLPSANIHIRVAYTGTNLIEQETLPDRIYMASSIKPHYAKVWVESYPEVLDMNTPLRCIDREVAMLIVWDIIGGNEDAMAVDVVRKAYGQTLEQVRGTYDLTAENVGDPNSQSTLGVLLNRLQEQQYTPAELIHLTLGPSSNDSLVAIRNMLAAKIDPEFPDLPITANEGDEEGQRAVAKRAEILRRTADYVASEANELVVGQGSTIAITKSTLAIQLNSNNSAVFSDISSLNKVIFDWVVGSKGGYSKVFRDALTQTVDDPRKVNRQHEIKHILAKLGYQGEVIEKSGYWLDSNSSGEGVVKFNSFARILLLESQEYIDVHYAVEVPFVVEVGEGEVETEGRIAEQAKVLSDKVAEILRGKLADVLGLDVS